MDLPVTFKTIQVTPMLGSYLVENFSHHLLYMRGQIPMSRAELSQVAEADAAEREERAQSGAAAGGRGGRRLTAASTYVKSIVKMDRALTGLGAGLREAFDCLRPVQAAFVLGTTIANPKEVHLMTFHYPMSFLFFEGKHHGGSDYSDGGGGGGDGGGATAMVVDDATTTSSPTAGADGYFDYRSLPWPPIPQQTLAAAFRKLLRLWIQTSHAVFARELRATKVFVLLRAARVVDGDPPPGFLPKAHWQPPPGNRRRRDPPHGTHVLGLDSATDPLDPAFRWAAGVLAVPPAAASEGQAAGGGGCGSSGSNREEQHLVGGARRPASSYSSRLDGGGDETWSPADAAMGSPSLDSQGSGASDGGSGAAGGGGALNLASSSSSALSSPGATASPAKKPRRRGVRGEHEDKDEQRYMHYQAAADGIDGSSSIGGGGGGGGGSGSDEEELIWYQWSQPLQGLKSRRK